MEGLLKASEISIDRVEDARNSLSVGEEIEVKIVSIDRNEDDTPTHRVARP